MIRNTSFVLVTLLLIIWADLEALDISTRLTPCGTFDPWRISSACYTPGKYKKCFFFFYHHLAMNLLMCLCIYVLCNIFFFLSLIDIFIFWLFSSILLRDIFSFILCSYILRLHWKESDFSSVVTDNRRQKHLEKSPQKNAENSLI